MTDYHLNDAVDKAAIPAAFSIPPTMKANVASISDANEKARWQANVDMWQASLKQPQ